MTPIPRQGLYAITSAAICTEAARLLSASDAALRGGARLLQYRDKHSPADRRRSQAVRLLELCRRSRVPLIINDDIELAADIGADGVHLGLDDGGVRLARAQLGPSAIIGVTCSGSLERALAAEADGASYVAFGAFFASQSKPQAPTIGPELLPAARAALGLPICVIGGITAQRAPGLIAAGADYVAAIEGIFGGDDPEAAAQAYAAAFAN